MLYRCLAVSFLTLVASTLAPAQAQRIPSGSYQQSCTNVRVRAGVVTAECSTTGGSRITSSTSVNCDGDIGNVNGYLRCNRGGHWSGGLPAGSYQLSCTNARMNGSRLAASCSATNGAASRRYST